ncbi:DEAD/DEAH box helicase [Corynebacterium cystitidis]|uniref:DEAD/DEAH box helicase n=1 Tax=Corynebacterium cystitidis TaxID=35757 RepID=UPI00211EBB90|nr:DEAD/DEAH box helicase [Corynebacterium cystitidis]
MQPDQDLDAATLLGDRILSRDDYVELVSGLEDSVARSVLSHQAGSKDFDDMAMRAVRFADILSHSSKHKHREHAYLIIALLNELGEQGYLGEESKSILSTVSAAVLAKLGNFPALEKLERDTEHFTYSLPDDRYFGRLVKESLQRSSDGNKVFTDAQYKIANDLASTDFYSFSGPTSLGKSFIIKDFIRSLITRDSFADKCVVFLVPTNALVSQTAKDLRNEIGDIDGVNVAIHPVQPKLVLDRFRATIYVFTPERLIRYLSTSGRAVELLVVDEAHRIVSPKDSRSSLFYFAIDQTLRRYASRLVFSSPSVANPEIFLDLFSKSPEGSLLVEERTVAQQRFFIDLAAMESCFFPAFFEEEPKQVATGDGFGSTPWRSIRFWANGTKSLVYLNTPNKVIDFALQHEPPKDHKPSKQVMALISKVKEEIHPDYYLIDALEKGVAFHHGRIPVTLREEIEAIFKDPESGVDCLVCTSTLLEGVNLPARNIFILTDKHGSGQSIEKLDFENLAGRAGRLTKDFKGNVFCMKIKDNEWGDAAETIQPSEPKAVTSFLLEPEKRRKKRYTDIEKVLLDQPLPKGRSIAEIESAERYAAILVIQNFSNQPSLLTEKFNERADNPSETLEKLKGELSVDPVVLRRSPELDPMTQENAIRQLKNLEAPVIIDSIERFDFESLLSVMDELSRLYNWRQREGRGYGRMFRPKASGEEHVRRLRYWTQLTLQWATGKPANLIIKSSIQYHEKVGVISLPNYDEADRKSPFQPETFDPDSKVHINQIIEDTMRDIEHGVGFRILSYLKNYRDLCIQVFGEERSGIDLSALIEFGTSSVTEIELQQAGYSRDSARELHSKAKAHLEISTNGSVTDINVEGIKADEELSDAVKDETRAIFAA